MADTGMESVANSPVAEAGIPKVEYTPKEAAAIEALRGLEPDQAERMANRMFGIRATEVLSDEQKATRIEERVNEAQARLKEGRATFVDKMVIEGMTAAAEQIGRVIAQTMTDSLFGSRKQPS